MNESDRHEATEARYRRIRSLRDAGASMRSIAATVETSLGTVQRAIKGYESPDPTPVRYTPDVSTFRMVLRFENLEHMRVEFTRMKRAGVVFEQEVPDA